MAKTQTILPLRIQPLELLEGQYVRYLAECPRASVRGNVVKMANRTTRHIAALHRSGRYVAAGLIALAGIMFSVFGFLSVSDGEHRLAALEFGNKAKAHRHILTADLAIAIDLLHTLEAYFSASDSVRRTEYQLFAKHARERIVGLRNTGWAPRVTHQDREAFESKIRADGFPDFEIWERDPQGRRVRAGDRAEYFPILYPDPVELTPHIHGFDIGSEPLRRDALQRARTPEKPSATKPIVLLTKPQFDDNRQAHPDGFMSFMSVHRTAADGSEALEGYVYGVFETAPMIESILASRTEPFGLDMYIYDPDGPVDARLLHWHPSRTRSEAAPVQREAELLSRPHWQSTLPIADQTWGVIFAPTEKYLPRAVSRTALATLLAGLLVTGMIVAYLLTKIRRAMRLEALNARVKATNTDLLALRAAFDDIDTGVMLVDAQLRVQFTNSMAREIWGLTERALSDHPTLPELIYSAIDKTAAECPHADLVGYLAGLLLTLRESEQATEDRELDNGEVVRCQCATLPNGGWMLSYSRVTDLVRQSEQLSTLANTDSMTGAFNRRRFLELAEAEWSHYSKTKHVPGHALSLLLLDIDLFKSVNDRFGHDVGDKAIRAVARACTQSLRDNEIFGRLGGEEFGILLPHTDIGQATALAERIRRQVENIELSVGDTAVPLTVSVGAASAAAGIADLGPLLKAADLALYEAKDTGRNRVVVAKPEVIVPQPVPHAV